MRVFSDEKELIFLISINYKSGLQRQIWVSGFNFYKKSAEWKLTFSPHQREEIERYVKSGCSEEKIFKEYLNMIQEVIFLGFDNIESVYQESCCLVNKFDDDFLELIGNTDIEFKGER